MSSLKGEMPLRLSAGFGWHAVVAIKEQPQQGEKVIADYGPLLGGPRFSVMLDRNDAVFLEVLDDDGMAYRAPTVEVKKDWWFHLECALVRQVAAAQYKLEVWINNELRSERIVQAKFSDLASAMGSLGTNVRGDQAAAFVMAELVAVEKSTPQERERLQGYFEARYKLSTQLEGAS